MPDKLVYIQNILGYLFVIKQKESPHWDLISHVSSLKIAEMKRGYVFGAETTKFPNTSSLKPVN